MPQIASKLLWKTTWVLGMLVPNSGVEAFTLAAASASSKSSTLTGIHEGMRKSPARVMILPDSRAKLPEDFDLWHHHLKVSMNCCEINSQVMFQRIQHFQEEIKLKCWSHRTNQFKSHNSCLLRLRKEHCQRVAYNSSLHSNTPAE